MPDTAPFRLGPDDTALAAETADDASQARVTLMLGPVVVSCDRWQAMALGMSLAGLLGGYFDGGPPADRRDGPAPPRH